MTNVTELTNDGQITKPRRPNLDYPFDESEAPTPGTVKKIVDGVFWVRMPLPISLEWINLWLLRDGDGWTIVDTGMATEDARNHWRKIFEECLDGLPVKRVIVTHMHPDHVGLAGWITRKFDCPLYMSRLEYTSCRMLVADTGREAPQAGIKFYEDAGWDNEAIETYKKRFGGFGRATSRLPDAYIRLRDGDEIDIGGSSWRVLTGEGHCPEHVCLFNAEQNLFISGDQLLPRISSNVSVFPTEPEADPLSDWINSCLKLKAELPEDVLVLPAHNLPFKGAHKRLDHLVRGHEVVLKRLKQKIRNPHRVIDLFPTIFGRKIERESYSLATGESIAHLNCLIERGEAKRIVTEDGYVMYEAVNA
ncbi:MBL fold metallo-hydrolase [Ponticaulis profundi]|uniref:MBL fold metallo-hydrolase n=1 Tax=Ponticaulis profundi TaxID=2665222 RepID=A0ABW1SEW7_9PROT